MIKGIISTVIIFVTTFVLLEVVFRLFTGFQTNPFQYTQTSRGILVTFRSNYSYTHYIEQINEVHLNEFGMHDISIAKKKLLNKAKRVGFFGDSFVAGVEIPLERNFVSLLNESLNQKAKNTICYNFGVCGTGNAYQYVLFNELIKDSLLLDKVVLCVFLGNDIDNNNPFKTSFRRFDWVVNEDSLVMQMRGEYNVARRTLDFLRNYSVSVNAFYEMLYNFSNNLNPSNKKANINPDLSSNTQESNNFLSKDELETIRLTVDLLREWRQQLSSNGVDFSIVTFRSNYPLLQREKHFSEKLEEFCTKEKIEFIPIVFQNPSSKHFMYQDGDVFKYGHLNELGHDSVAKMLFERLFDN